LCQRWQVGKKVNPHREGGGETCNSSNKRVKERLISSHLKDQIPNERNKLAPLVLLCPGKNIDQGQPAEETSRKGGKKKPHPIGAGARKNLPDPKASS